MPPSQLKRLKASLREQGIIGPQQSKKQKKKNLQNGASKDRNFQRAAALSGIREQFNPFEVKLSAKGPKFEVTSSRSTRSQTNGIKGRPGVSKGLGEENRRRTLLVEMQRRNKIGGIVDRRFGENDPTMAPEEKMLGRFAQEVQQRHKNNSVFDLEDDDDQVELTHMGQSLYLDGAALKDDFDEGDLSLSNEDDHEVDHNRSSLKRRRSKEEEDDEAGDADLETVPERKKTKQEVMKEVIAKSKLYKYERQALKDADEDMREALDSEMPALRELLSGGPMRQQQPQDMNFQGMNPERAALINSAEKSQMNKEYDLRLRQLAQDKKAQPAERTKTEEERIAEESEKLRNLEAQRLRRMQGQPDDDNDEERYETDGASEVDDDLEGEDDNFGLGSGIKIHTEKEALGVEDEDDFIIDDDLVATGSDIDSSNDDQSEYFSETDVADDTEFVGGLLTEAEEGNSEFLEGLDTSFKDPTLPPLNGINGDLAYTFPCPQTHSELLSITKTIATNDLPTVVRRIRALFHPKLKSENKKLLANFTSTLIDHVAYLSNQHQPASTPFDVLESLIRHIHSLAKSFPVDVANRFRFHIQELHEKRPLNPNIGDLVLLTAISTIFPTSDHFHQVVTPAMLSMARYLGQKVPQSLADYTIGAYLATLCLQYQRLSKRYLPELVGFLLNTLRALAPVKIAKTRGAFHHHESKISLHSDLYGDIKVRPMSVMDIKQHERTAGADAELEVSLIQTALDLLNVAGETWIGKPAFQEVFGPALEILKVMNGKECRKQLPQTIQTSVAKTFQKLSVLMKQTELARRPLELHHHRSLAIKTSIPKFEESFDPDKHYDPDRERAEASKLRAEHKRERKGAMRELRKDANFIARESLREKKERDAAYEKKYKRLVAEIQGEEGRESKEYEKEKQWRKKGRR